MILAWALVATLLAAIFLIGGIRIIRYADHMEDERNRARLVTIEQAHETERLAEGLRSGCRVVRQLLEARPEDEKWQDAEDFLTEYEGVADEETT